MKALPPLSAEALHTVREQMIFTCYKLDPQVGDVDVLTPFPIVINETVWHYLASQAEKLAAETSAMEEELIQRPELHGVLGLPLPLRRVLRSCGARASAGGARLVRFDFHFTTEGWKISEANSDVPGGFNEAAGFSRLMAPHYPGTRIAEDPAVFLSRAIMKEVGAGAAVALVHATAYTDDRQVMMYLADRLTDLGMETHLLAPDQLIWKDGRAFLHNAWSSGPVDFVLRFFPSEWLANLPRRSHWKRYFAGSLTPMCNPATAVLTQSKRLPLVWDRLRTPVPTWQSLLPETRDPRDCDGRNEDWVVKPALGRVGEDVLIPGVTEARQEKGIRKAVARHHGLWAAQKRFHIAPVIADGAAWYACVGIYTVGGKAAGTYGRVSRTPLIDSSARDVPILVKEGE